MAPQPKEEKEGMFNVILVGALLLGGAGGGGAMARHIIPDSQIASMVGLILIPLGVIVGLSIAQGVAPPMSLLNLFSVLDGRHSMNDIAPQGGSMKVNVWLLVGPALVGVVLALILDMFVKPEAPFMEVAGWFAGTGVVFGLVLAGLVVVLTPE